MSATVQHHYELYPYPHYPLLASVRRCDTYALNLESLWARFNGERPPAGAEKILIAGCGSFAPYPYAVANPGAEITALDLSGKSLDRARLHCLLHGKLSIKYRCGDLLDPKTCDSRFGMIDAFGVLHHLEHPLTGLKALASRLCDGGIIRIMVYSRYARREEESIRRALKLLRVHDTCTLKSMIARSRPNSRLRLYAGASSEARFDSGLADALLHPCVRTYRIEELMELVSSSGLTPLLFAHDNALDSVTEEVERIRALEAERSSPGNFILYLGRNVRGTCRENRDSLIKLNPCLNGSVGKFRIQSLRIAPRMGHETELLDRSKRQFLRRFIKPVKWSTLDEKTRAEAQAYIKSLFLLHYNLNP
ncbi:MAG: SAM-dependent methyltransferase [Geobacteraceae bacterium GWC2_48_7]|nr:MAG: SAM-dependent methyltransferase [Geobacteraceae bacterium GWC2_48_7]